VSIGASDQTEVGVQGGLRVDHPPSLFALQKASA
jgi:hypothetical protein